VGSFLTEDWREDMSTHHDKDYFDRLLRRGPYSRNLSSLRDDELQQIICDGRNRERLMPTVEDAEELLDLADEAKGVLSVRHPGQRAGMK
jgi:hypothetical protein